MSASHSLLRRALLALAGAAAASAAFAGPGELTLLSEPSMQGVLTAAAKQFEKETGQHVALMFPKPNQLAAAFKGMNHPDVVVLPDEAMDRLVQGKQAAAGTRQGFGQVGVAVVVKSGAAKPDVATPEALQQALKGAKSIVYADPGENPAGRQAAQVVAKLGIADGLKDKTTLAAGSNPLGQVSLGAAEIGLHAMHEALDASGVVVVGPVPGAVQQWAPYAMALAAEAPNESEAKQLMAFLAGAAGRRLLDSKGVSAIAR
jgi:molybdate transport system substrate-binding protein